MTPRDAVAVADLPGWDRYGPETPGLPEACFFFELAADHKASAQTLLRQRRRRPRRQPEVQQERSCPASRCGKTPRPSADGYVTGLEPGINFPNAKSFEKRMGRVTILAPGESRTYAVTIEALADQSGVQAAAAAVAALQATVKPEICSAPDPAWSGK